MKRLFYPASLALLLCLGACMEPKILSPEPDSEFPATIRDGITRLSDDSLAFVLFAPQKQTAYLIGDFNDWTTSKPYQMKKDGDRFRIKIGNLDPNKEYRCQYLIDDQIRIADPYAGKISDPHNDGSIPAAIYPDLIPYPAGKTTEIAMVVSTGNEAYPWKIKDFTPQTQGENLAQALVIYEILIRDFTEQRSIKGVQEKLPYLKALGVNAIELMPFNEFEGNDSWGYNPSFYFAPDKAYGTPNDYKAFIDACHENGIAVIMDIVLNHSYGQSPLVRLYQDVDGKPSANNPWHHSASPNTSYAWGCDFNHESPHTQAFVDSVCAFWIREYKIDGYRFDFTKGFTNKAGDGQARDESRIRILQRMVGEIRKRKHDAILIFEHLADNSEEKELSDHGILLWGNLNRNTNEATMGWGEERNSDGSLKGDLSWASYKQRGWTKPHLVTYIESHDEERLMYKNQQWGKEITGYSVKQIPTGLQRSAAAAVIWLALPGPKMIWQFGELGYDYPLGSTMEDGRLDPKPIRWDYLEQAPRQALHRVYAQMIAWRQTKAVFAANQYAAHLAGNFKTVLLESENETALAMANFDVTEKTQTVRFGKTGTWRDAFSGHEITLDSDTKNINLQPGEYRLYFHSGFEQAKEK